MKMRIWEIPIWFFIFLYLILPIIMKTGGAVDFEERYAGALHEPIQVVEIEKRGGKLFPVYNSPSHGPSNARIKSIFGMEMIFQEAYPEVKMRIGTNTFPLLPRLHIGPIPILLQRISMEVISKSVFSARLVTAIIAFLFLYAFYRLLLDTGAYRSIAYLCVLFLLFHPAPSGRFRPATSTNEVMCYLCFTLFLRFLLKEKKPFIIMGILAGLMLHSNLLVGGAALSSLLISYLIHFPPEKIPSRKLLISCAAGALFLFPFFLHFLFSPAGGLRTVYPHKLEPLFHLKLLKGALENTFYLLFLPAREMLRIAGIKSPPSLNLLSIVPGTVLVIFFFLALLRREKLARIPVFFVLFYLLFGSLRITRPHHYILFLPLLLLEAALQTRKRKAFGILPLAAGVLFLILTNIKAFSIFLDSIYNVRIHESIGMNLVKKGITSPYLLMGPFGYELLTDGKVRGVDFTPFLAKYPYRLDEVILVSEGKYLLVRGEDCKESCPLGVSIERVLEVTYSLSMEVEPILTFGRRPDSPPVAYLLKMGKISPQKLR